MAFQERTYSHKEVYDALRPVCGPHTDFYILMTLATVISTFGLLLNNPAVIIGAMLIAPLMDPILGISFSSLTRNPPFLVRSAVTLISGVALAVLASYLLSLPFPSLSLSDEVLARTKPSLLDMFVALATGFVAGYAKVRKNLGGALYGVAVSISLVPPLCVIGIGLSVGKQEIFTGASLLFLTNLASILFSGVLAFLLIRLGNTQKSLKALIFPGVSLAILAIPLSFSLYTIQQQKKLEAELTRILRMDTHTFRTLDIIGIETDVFSKPVKLAVTVRGGEKSMSPKQIGMVEALLRRRVGTPVSLTVYLSPVLQMKAESESDE